MSYHILFDRTERLFSKGQRALAARDAEGAARHFEAAISTDPDYAHLYMYLGIAKAELGQLDDALSAIRKALELDPRNFVFPMELGVRHLDAGAPKAAIEHFIEASRLAPQNILVINYIRLASWELGEGGIEEIIEQIKDIPPSFRARFFLSLLERLIKCGRLAPAIDDPFAAHGMAASTVRRNTVVAWWRRRTLRKAQQQIDRGDLEGALNTLLSLEGSQSDSDVAALLAEARTKAIDLIHQKLNAPHQKAGWLERLWRWVAGSDANSTRPDGDRSVSRNHFAPLLKPPRFTESVGDQYRRASSITLQSPSIAISMSTTSASIAAVSFFTVFAMFWSPFSSAPRRGTNPPCAVWCCCSTPSRPPGPTATSPSSARGS
jgi:Tetratricopeptide repeat